MKSSTPAFYETDGFIYTLFGVAALIVVMGLGLTVWDWNAGNSNWDNRGVRGDFWGGHIGAFANFAAFIILVAATMLQRKELIESRLVNGQIAKEAEAQAKALQDQIKLGINSQHIGSFFQLMSFFEASERSLKTTNGYASGRAFIKNLAESIDSRQNDSGYRESFPELMQYCSWVEVIWKTTEQHFTDTETPTAVFNAKFNKKFLRELKTIIHYYDMPNHNLQEQTPDLWRKLQLITVQ